MCDYSIEALKRRERFNNLEMGARYEEPYSILLNKDGKSLHCIDCKYYRADKIFTKTGTCLRMKFMGAMDTVSCYGTCMKFLLDDKIIWGDMKYYKEIPYTTNSNTCKYIMGIIDSVPDLSCREIDKEIRAKQRYKEKINSEIKRINEKNRC